MRPHPQPSAKPNLQATVRTSTAPIKVVLFNKPYGVHSQFRRDHATMHTLADFVTDKSLRIAGRLDADSEGLLILTDSGALNHAITTPPTSKNHNKQPKRYLVQVEGVPSAAMLAQLRQGVLLKDGKTRPAQVTQLDDNALPITLWARVPPIRERKSIPTTWLEIAIVEGKNRQVRRMTAHVGLPCLRLIRHQVAGFHLGDLAVGQLRVLHLTWAQLADFGIRLPAAQKAAKIKTFANAHLPKEQAFKTARRQANRRDKKR